MAMAEIASSAVARQAPLPELQRIDRDRLCVTNGSVSAAGDGRLAIETPSSRAVVQAGAKNAADQVAEIRFSYLGPSDDSRPLASGILRRQIGLKLQAEDGCNLIYVMWHIEPDASVAVLLKRNIGLRTHQQCGVRGYVNLKSQIGDSLPPIRAGESHKLRAELHGRDLTVTADDKVAWQGVLGGETALPAGPPGFRTDNARFALEFFAASPVRSQATVQQTSSGRNRCVISPGD